MKLRRMEFPHPVLSVETNDYPECNFYTEIVEMDDAGEDIEVKIEFKIECSDIQNLILNRQAKPIVRVTCPRTSYRAVFSEDSFSGIIVVRIEKWRISDAIEVQSFIVANEEIASFLPEQRNEEYFGNIPFKIKEGDILAIELGKTIKLDTEYEKEAAGVINVVLSQGDKLKVKYATVDEEDPQFAQYITILMPQNMHSKYNSLRKRKMYKKNVERFLQAAVVLPAIVEAIGLLILEENYETECTYKGTLWAESIIQALRNHHIEIGESTGFSNYEMANIILKDVINDSLTDLIRKMDDIDSSFREVVQ